MKTKLPYGLGTTVVFSIVTIAAMAVLSTSDSMLNAYAQNTTSPTQTATPQPSTNQTADPQQIKNYLTQAIQALDSGNNTKALDQIDLAGDQLESMTGTEDDGEDEGEVEEGPGEDADEPGDIDTNDEEDTP
jgi:hypothetical protein